MVHKQSQPEFVTMAHVRLLTPCHLQKLLHSRFAAALPDGNILESAAASQELQLA